MNANATVCHLKPSAILDFEISPEAVRVTLASGRKLVFRTTGAQTLVGGDVLFYLQADKSDIASAELRGGLRLVQTKWGELQVCDACHCAVRQGETCECMRKADDKRKQLEVVKPS